MGSVAPQKPCGMVVTKQRSGHTPMPPSHSCFISATTNCQEGFHKETKFLSSPGLDKGLTS